MTKIALEHVNLTVRDPQKTAAMLEDVFGWKVRWHGVAKENGLTYHVGEEDFYLALYTPQNPRKGAAGANIAIGGLNHIGVVVNDLDAIEKRIIKAGFEPFSHGDYEPGRRFYFIDPDGIEFEVVSYA